MIQPQLQNESEKLKSLALAGAVHLALVIALFLGVQWKSRTPESVEVELWNNVPVQRSVPIAPPVQKPEPTPPPPKPELRQEPNPEVKHTPKVEPKPEFKPEPKPVLKPDIAVKEDRKKVEEPTKKSEPLPEPKPKPKPEAKPEPKKLEPPRPSFDEELKREQKQVEQKKRWAAQAAREESETRAQEEARNEQSAAARKRALKAYLDKIGGKIRGNTVLPQGIEGNPESIFRVTQLPSGEVIDVKLTRSSGNPTLDEAFERAIWRSSPLPKPDQPELFDRSLEIKRKPFDR